MEDRQQITDMTALKKDLQDFKQEMCCSIRRATVIQVCTIIATGGLVLAIMRFTSGS